jgi:hypothetical protein
VARFALLDHGDLLEFAAQRFDFVISLWAIEQTTTNQEVTERA